MERNLVEYHKSIAEEMRSTKNRIRHLIGSSHWLSDGLHKEAVLRKTLRGLLPESNHVGTGFVCCPMGNTSQIDVLITDHNKPALFKDGEWVFVTPDAVKAIIEVKTSLDAGTFRAALEKLSKDVSKIRLHNKDCKAGLFVFEEGHIDSVSCLSILKEVTNNKKGNVINWIALGSNKFIRYWEHGKRQVNSTIADPVWHLYEIDALSQAYFVSNVIWDISPQTLSIMQFAWFPIEGSKELYRKWYIPLKGPGQPKEFIPKEH